MNFGTFRRNSFLCLLVVVWSHAVGVPNLHINELVNASDLIAIVDITSLKMIRPAPPIVFRDQMLEAQALSSEVQVRRTIKGLASGHLTIKYTVPKLFIGYRTLQPGTRIVFLRREGAEYTVANPYYPDFPAVSSLQAQPAESPGSDYVTAVVHEMVAVIASDIASPEEKAQILQVSYALPSSNNVIAALQEGLLRAGDDGLKQRLQSELIRLGDITELPEVARLLLTNSVSPNQKIGFLYVIGNSVRVPGALPALELLLRAGDSSIRTSAMEALWHIADPRATNVLVSGLEDPSRDVRYYAVRGLAEITGEIQWGPSISEFQEHEQQYLAHWREWSHLAAPR